MKYAYSIKTTRVKEPDFPYPEKELGSTAAVVQFVRALQDSDVEKMIVLYTDAQNKLICIHVDTGIANQCVVYPRAILRQALLVNACGIIMVHNHPSGNLKPSDADIRLTNIVKDTAKTLDILVHDHMIIGENNRVFSMREEGIIF